MVRHLAPRVAITLAALLVAACTAPGTSGAAATAKASTSSAASPSGELAKLRARGTLIVGIRVEAPPPNRTAGDPAHAQKRAFESAVATMLVIKILGANAKVELRSIGGDRLVGLDQGIDVVMTGDTAPAHDRAFVSIPYAGAGITLAAKDGAAVRRVEDISGQTIAVGQDEVGARELAQAVLQQRGLQATLTNYMGVSGAVAAAEDGKAAAIIGDKIGLAFLAKDRSLTLIADLAKRPYVLATRKSAPDLASAIDDALRALLASGEIRDAAKRAAFPYEIP